MFTNRFRFVVDAVLFLLMLSLIFTGLLMSFVLPHGSRAGNVWSMTRHEWGDVHFWIAMSMLAGLLIHLMLNWGWVCTVVVRLFRGRMPKPRSLVRNIAGAGVLVIVIGGMAGGLWMANSAKADMGVRPSASSASSDHEDRPSGRAWRGGRLE